MRRRTMVRGITEMEPAVPPGHGPDIPHPCCLDCRLAAGLARRAEHLIGPAVIDVLNDNGVGLLATVKSPRTIAAFSFDHLIGLGQDIGWKDDAESFRSSQI